MARPCRHFLGLYPSNRPSCAKGRDVRAWAVRCNGSSLGIAKQLPCSDERDNPLFQCPELDRKTAEEVEAERAAFSEYVDKIVAAMPKIFELKQKMVKRGLRIAKANCPWCDGKDTLRLNCNLDGNKHIAVKCSECDAGFIE